MKGSWKGVMKKAIGKADGITQLKGNLKGSRNIEGDPKFDSDVCLKDTLGGSLKRQLNLQFERQVTKTT